MRTVFRFAFVCALVTPAASFAQSPNSNVADQAWANVSALNRAAVSSPVSHDPQKPQQAAADKKQKAQKFRQTAQAAKDFYTKYPGDPNAAAAKKLEALAGLEGITDDDATYEQSALKVAGDFRTNKSNPISDRYEIAHAMERHDVSKKLGGKHWLSSAAEAEQMADRLHAEFGHLPEAYGNYLNVAEHVNCDRGVEMARRILQMPAPPEIKAGAQRIVDRYALMGKPFDIALTTAQGKSTTLGQLVGRLTVVCFWDGSRSPAGPPGLQDFKKSSPDRTAWVYVSLGALGSLSKGDKPRSLPTGTICVEPLGLRSPIATQLKVAQMPWVVVLDETKSVAGFGRPDELAWLLANPHRLLEP